ncbi:MAG: SPOR domain-containing protein [bacterium]|nr:SPOR domain-containing protein [bacterium]
MKHRCLVLIITLLGTTMIARAAEEEVQVPVPGLQAAEPGLPGADEPSSSPTSPPTAPTNSVVTNLPQTTNLPAPKAATPATPTAYPPGTVFTVQLGAFQSRERAFALYWDLSKKISPLQVTAPAAKDKLYRVRYGSYPNYAEAKAAAEKVKARGIDCFVAALSPEGENITSPPNQR